MNSSTPCSSTTTSSRAISSPSSQFSTSPSTAKSSIFSSAESLLSTSPASPLSCTTFKRKHGRETQQAKSSLKRRKVMGRPKNAWTPTRLRKLVRLYLMTNLKVTQIANVLQSKDFHPSLRDTQEQLKSLLQARPNTIRLGAHITKARLLVLRDCRELRKSQRSARLQLPTSRNDVRLEEEYHRSRHAEEALLVDDDFGDDWSWLDLGLGANQAQSPEGFTTQSTARLQDGPLKPRGVCATSMDASSEMEALFPFEMMSASRPSNFHDFDSAVEQQPTESVAKSPPMNLPPSSLRNESNERVKDKWASLNGVPPPLVDEWILPDFRMAPKPSEPQSLHPPYVSANTDPTPRSLDTPELLVEDYDLNRIVATSVKSPKETDLESHSEQMTAENALPSTFPHDEGRLPIGGRPPRNSITSLTKRLPECSQSCIEEIASILERHTIGGSSVASSSARTSHISSRKSSRVFLKQPDIEKGLSLTHEPPLLPVKVKPPNVLPGIFHVYCAAQVNQNKLRHCRGDGLPCEHTCSGAQKFFTSHIASKVVIYNRVRSRDINEADQFGNSILHVAASFCAPISYMIKLIRERANINATNAAGETFLHLLYAPYEEDEVCSLLEFLSFQRFNFGQHDQHGQTSLHLITRPWFPQQYLVKVVRKIQSLGFVLPTSRDNLGFTILRQMKHLGTQALGFDPGQEMAFRLSLGLTCETQGYIVRPPNPVVSVNHTFNGNESLRRDENQKFVNNLDDLRRYEHHADLLRTIIKAGDRPWYEDSKGRNGLHCLAEVAFDLPLDNNPTSQNPCPQDQEAANRKALREAYLEGLVAARVNSNNYNKKGNTPLMSFLIYQRTGEDDGATVNILNKLLAAGADIHRRNRRGETALHLAVKSGRLGATSLLLRKGANVHARNKKGSGILKVGTEACKKATQDENLYAQIMLCMDVAMRAGAVASPTILQEWSLDSVVHAEII